jgi:A/G-specific adenine glycosylase
LHGAKWRRVPGEVRHVFTHFPLALAVFLTPVARGVPAPKGMRWQKLDGVFGEALPNVMRKVLSHALATVRPAGGVNDKRPSGDPYA